VPTLAALALAAGWLAASPLAAASLAAPLFALPLAVLPLAAVDLLPPPWLVRGAVAAVWLYEGLWCKLMGGDPRQVEVVEAVPTLGPKVGRLFLKTLGVVEVGMAAWALSGVTPVPCAIAQTALLATLNANGVIWSRHLIHDPAGMLVKNAAFLVLAWVAASLPPGGS
jgi:hypothetical protein